MDSCDVLIAGGGPAGSTCAWALRQAGVDDVLVVDKASFPRDKVCAGWITPQVIEALRMDTQAYRQHHTFQEMTGLRVGVIGGPRPVEVRYDKPVSYGILRCEFDAYLLRRSGARLQLGTPIESIRRDGSTWVVNDAIRTRMLVGAGGHFCPVATLLNGSARGGPVVAAREIEVPLDNEESPGISVAGERPEIYFCDDMQGYGWCFRKGAHLNVGIGRLDAHALPKAAADFVAFLTATGVLPESWRSDAEQSTHRWRGHAYLLSRPRCRRSVDEGMLLVGDAAGLAYAQSGEGIRPAVESGLMAASTIVGAAGRYSREQLGSYERRLNERFDRRAGARRMPDAVGEALGAVARSLLRSPWFVRAVVLDRFFLHAREPALVAASG